MTDRSSAAAGGYPSTGYAEPIVTPAALRRISWAAVFAGAAIAAAVHLLLTLLGLGIGLSAVDTGTGGSTPEASTLGTGAGIWWVVSSLVSLFIGGYVAARLSGFPVRGDGMIHGLLTWAVTLIVTVWMLGTAASGLVGGAFTVISDTVSATGQGLAEVAPEMAQATGVSPEDLREQAQELLRPGGTADISDPEVALRELVSALTTMATGSEQEAQQARERAVGIVSQQADIPRQEAEQRLDQFAAEMQQTVDQASQAAASAADQAAGASSWGAIWAFIAFLLGAAAGALGGGVGTRRAATVAAATR